MTVDLELPAHPDSVARARQAVAQLDGEIGRTRREDLRLLVSEVVTNAIRHAAAGPQDAVHLRIAARDAHVRVEVTDPGRGFAAPDLDPEPGRAGGWGLWLVEQLADAWGIQGSRGTCVWFELRLR